MRELVFCLEEESAKVLLTQVIQQIIPNDGGVVSCFIVFEGKQALMKRLAKRLSGYLNAQAQFIVLRDQDSENCEDLKEELMGLCKSGGKPDAIVRIACRELESFYLGDLRAVELGMQVSGLSDKQDKAKYRVPDQIPSPSKELARLTGNKYQKIAGSREIAPHLNLENPRSRSFHHLLHAIRKASDRLQSLTSS